MRRAYARKMPVVLALAFVALLAAPGAVPAAAPVARTVGSTCPGPDAVSVQAQRAGLVSFTLEPDAGTWDPWFVDAADVPVAAPPATLSVETAEELAELKAMQANRTSQQVLKARGYDGVPTRVWTELYLQLVVEHSDKNGIKNPPTLSRQIGLLHQAMYDALLVTWNAKYCHERVPPSALDPTLSPVVDVPAAPSYPSEHAAVAGAAAVMMASFFPPGEEPEGRFHRMAEEIAESRLWGGASYRSDVDAGLALGLAVGETILAARAGDGSDVSIASNVANAPVPRILGTCNWSPTLPSFGGPLLPGWGKVSPFLMASGDQFLPPPPPACDGETYLAQSRDLYDASLERTPRMVEIADRWAGGQGTVTPPGQWIHLALNATLDGDLNTMRQARVMSYVGAALADAGISAWNTKYTYWSDRPIHAIRRHWDPEWDACAPCHTPTPPFPGYVSGHSTFGGAAMGTLAHFFPDRETELSSYATEAAMSRFFGGIHIRADNDWGLWSGYGIADLASARAMADGAE